MHARQWAPLEPAKLRVFDVICAGEALWRVAGHAGLTPSPRSVRFTPGGGALNAALALARRGVAVGLATAVADDPFGRALLERVVGAGIDVGGVTFASPRAGLMLFDGTGAARNLVPHRAEEQTFTVPSTWSSRVLLLSGLSPVVSHGAAVCASARAARRAGTVVVIEVSARWRLWAGHDARAIRMALREADIVVCTEEDLAVLDLDARAMRAAMRPRAVLVTTSRTTGACAAGPFGEALAPPQKELVLDPDRSGDPLVAAIAHELGRSNDPAEDLDLWQRVLGVRAVVR
jgi:sugar/nucleoside kinase (ribokinase family)